MKKLLVTGVGGGVGQSLIKALQFSEYEVIAVDSSTQAVGLYVNNKSYLGFQANDPQFIPRLLEICKIENVGIIFPGHDVELIPLAEAKSKFKNYGITISISEPNIIEICDDKLKTYKFLTENGFNSPKTVLFENFKWQEGSYVLKPRIGGARSRNTYVVHNFLEFEIYSKLIDPNNCVVQEFIAGTEYTCGAIKLLDDCENVIVMRRELRSGDTYKAYVEKNLQIKDYIKKVIDTLSPFGACNVQLKFRNGEIYIFEINARSSGTTAARALAGFNEPLAIANTILQNKPTLLIDNEITIFRYWQELSVENNAILHLKENGFVNPCGKNL